jgi:hypothetical protein
MNPIFKFFVFGRRDPFGGKDTRWSKPYLSGKSLDKTRLHKMLFLLEILISKNRGGQMDVLQRKGYGGSPIFWGIFFVT